MEVDSMSTNKSNPSVVLRLALVLLLLAAVITILRPDTAPHDVNEPVNPAALSWIGGDPCSADGGVVSATYQNDTGGFKLYGVVCSDGAQLTASAR
jgi:hypothetical protein